MSILALKSKLLAAALLAAALMVVGASSDSVKRSSAVNHADARFVMMRIPHHQQAVRMSTIILGKAGVDPVLQQMGPERRGVVTVSFYLGLTHHEIAEQCDELTVDGATRLGDIRQTIETPTSAAALTAPEGAVTRRLGDYGMGLRMPATNQ